MSAIQVMPLLSAEEYESLRHDIVQRGVVVPVVVDQHGRLLDGHHRRQIADELGIDCPVEVRHVADDEDARTVAFTLILTRRHLTREQRRDLIAREAEARPEDSDRAIARQVGCSPSTVGPVRRPVSNLDTSRTITETAAAARSTESIRTELAEMDDLVETCLRRGLDPLTLVGGLTAALADMAAVNPDEDFLGPVREHLIQPRIDGLLAVMSR